VNAPAPLPAVLPEVADLRTRLLPGGAPHRPRTASAGRHHAAPRRGRTEHRQEGLQKTRG